MVSTSRGHVLVFEEPSTASIAKPLKTSIPRRASWLNNRGGLTERTCYTQSVFKLYKPPHRKGPRFFLVVRFFTVAFFDLLKPVKRVSSPDPVIDDSKLQIWMVGHATMLINFYGTKILTDPVFGNWLPFPRRKVGPGLQLSQLPPIDIILQSHTHWDHYHIPSVRKVATPDTTLIIAKNCADLAADINFKAVVELEKGENHHVDDVKITTYQPHHWGQRVPWEKPKRGFNAYVVEKNGQTIFFSGDTGYGPVFSEVKENHEVDLALLPIGAYSPDSFRKVHMNPEDALWAMADLNATEMIPFHFGTFRLSREPMDEPASWLRQLVEQRGLSGVTILHNGEYYERF
jgi:L-ascorbate metabolism protein UlaG (beta-lactamase superfamily)